MVRNVGKWFAMVYMVFLAFLTFCIVDVSKNWAYH